MSPPFDPRNAHLYPALNGVDEVGRGCLSGPVFTCCVFFDPQVLPPDLLGALDDSKRLSARKREFLTQQLMNVAAVAVAASSAARIDSSNIRAMTLDAMRRAVVRLGINAPVRIDGRDVPPGIPFPCKAVVKGDATVPQIAAASIIAKTLRDRLMTRLAARYPGYGWERNAGYGTAEHLAALDRLGPTPHHRRSFAPLSQLRYPLELSLVPEGCP